MELLIPADSEVAALDELSTMLPAHGFPGVSVPAGGLGTKLPTVSPKPPEFGRLFAPGGIPRDLVTDTMTLAVEGYALKEQRARDLCAYMIAIIEAAGRAGSLGGRTCYGARAASMPGNLPNPTVPDRYRFTAMISVALRRTTV